MKTKCLTTFVIMALVLVLVPASTFAAIEKGENSKEALSRSLEEEWLGNVLMLPFDEPVGSTIFIDLSGYNNNAVCLGDTCPSAGNSGHLNQSVSFDGNDYLEIPHNAAFNPIEDRNNVSVSAWVSVNEWWNGGNFAIVNQYADNDNGWEFYINYDSLTFSAQLWKAVSCPYQFNKNEWYQVAMSYYRNLGQIHFYVNGSEICNTLFSEDIVDASDKPMYIGYNPTGADEYAMGLIDELYIFYPGSAIYFPFITKPVVGLTGKVTVNGIPAAGVAVDLRFYNGSSWSTYASMTTTLDGSYTFTNVPALAAGQSYYIRYLNTTDSSRLYTWHTGVNSTYKRTSMDKFDSFEIANIELLKPDPGTTVKLPYTFTWTPRPATPTDSYEFDLYDPTDGDPWFYTDPALGYVGSYTLTKRPTAFLNGVNYGWDVEVYSPDGGYGASFYYYPIKFTSSPGGLASLERMSGSRQHSSSLEAPGIQADR